MLPNPTAADFLAPQFARIIFFAPDRTRPHMLSKDACPANGMDLTQRLMAIHAHAGILFTTILSGHLMIKMGQLASSLAVATTVK